MVSIHHPVTGATVNVPTKALNAHLKRGWVLVDAPPATSAAAPVVASVVDPVDVDERASLLKLADELGVEVDRRWGVSRLSAAIAAHQGDDNITGDGDDYNVPEGDEDPTPSQED